MNIKTKFHKGVSKEVQTNVNRVCAQLPDLTDIQHKILVEIVPHESVGDGKECGFAVAVCPKQKDEPFSIFVAAGALKVLIKEGEYPKKEAMKELMVFMVHEFVHYEQWRDGRELTERGVQVRARNLLVKINP